MEHENGVEVTAEDAQMNPENLSSKDSHLYKIEGSDSVDGVLEMGDVTDGVVETLDNTDSNLNGNENEAILDSSVEADKQDDTSEPFAENNQTTEPDVCSDNPNDANASSQIINDLQETNDGCPPESIRTEASEHSISLQNTSADAVSFEFTEESNREQLHKSPEVLNCSDQNHHTEAENGRPTSTEVKEEKSEAVTSTLTVTTEATTTVHISNSLENGEVVTAEDEDGTENVILSDEEAKLLEKLKYQPFDVAQELESLTSEQREKINLYQRRESLARVNSLKRHSPSSSISIGKRPSASSQGQSDLLSGPPDQEQETCPRSSALLYVRQKYNNPTNEESPLGTADSKKELEQAEEDVMPERKVDTSTDLYQCMRLLAPKPYPNDSSNPSSPTHQKYSPGTPDLAAKYTSLPKTNKMSSEGDILAGLKDSSRLDRSQSFKTQADIDRNRQNVNAMRMKFLGIEVPPNIPNNNISKLDSPDGAEHNEVLNDEIEDFVVSKNDVKLESAVKPPPHTPKTKSGIDPEPVAESTPISDQKAKDGPLARSFYKLLCGSGNTAKD